MNFVDEWFQAKVQTVVFDLRYFSIDCSQVKKESQQSFLHQNGALWDEGQKLNVFVRRI